MLKECQWIAQLPSTQSNPIPLHHVLVSLRFHNQLHQTPALIWEKEYEGVIINHIERSWVINIQLLTHNINTP